LRNKIPSWHPKLKSGASAGGGAFGGGATRVVLHSVEGATVSGGAAFGEVATASGGVAFGGGASEEAGAA
jgi:hypothetical protein